MSKGTGSGLLFIRGVQLGSSYWTPVGILDDSLHVWGDMSEAKGWHALIKVIIHSRHPTWLATSQVPSMAGFFAGSGGDSFVAYH